jgi:ketosteroid isomerase-like protein
MGAWAMRYVTAIILIAVFAAGCGQNKTADVETIKETLIKTDRDFSQMSVDKGMREAFDAYMDANAIVYQQNSDPISGRADILDLYPETGNQQGTLSWNPFFADAGSGDDLGYTLGRWSYTGTDSTGQEVELDYGYYVTIWKKQADGSWKYVFDSGVQGPGEDEENSEQKDEE